MTGRKKIGKINRVNVDFGAYDYYLRGIAGIGKTTIAHEIGQMLFGDEGMLIVSVGRESGFDHLDGAFVAEATNWAELKEIVETIIKYKNEDYPNLRMVCIDSTDELFRIAEAEVVRMHNSMCSPDKRVKSVKGAFGGFTAGEQKAVDIVVELLWSLNKVGVNRFFIGHTKIKSSQDVITGIEFDQLTTNLPFRYDNAIKDKVYVTGTGYIEREINDVKSGVEDKIKKSKLRNAVEDERRVIVFRDDSHTVDTKSRFANITPKIPFDAKAFIKAVEDGIRGQVKGGSGLGKRADVVVVDEIPFEEERESMVAVEVPELVEVVYDRTEDVKYIASQYKTMGEELQQTMLSMLKDSGVAKLGEASDEVVKQIADMIRGQIG